MHDILKANGIPLENGLIKINPEEFSRIFIDVGLSSDAHQSENWLNSHSGALVFGFEPVPSNIQSIKEGLSTHNVKLNPSRISHSFHLLPVALGEQESGQLIPFYLVAHDLGCSSILPPKRFEIADVINVPIYRLEDFLQMIPWDLYPHIDFIKVDAQGKDLEIIKSAGEMLNRIFAICLEVDSDSYIGSRNSLFSSVFYLLSKGFLPINLGKKWRGTNAILRIFFRLFSKVLRVEYTFNSVDPCFVNVHLFLSRRVLPLGIRVD